MLEFINNNGVLFSGICTVIGALIAALAAVLIERKKDKKDTAKSLREELEKTKKCLERTKSELNRIRNLENLEKNIDKSRGSVYHEKLSNGASRTICGYCWEKDHVRIPIIPEYHYNVDANQSYYSGYCQVCGARCIMDIVDGKLSFMQNIDN